MSLSLKIPTGPKPNWEVDNEGKAPLKSVYESGSIHHILRQSRTAWLNNVFPKFISKGKGKANAELPPPPPHTLRLVSNCDVEIGPHIFYECQFYEAVYMPDPVELAVVPEASSQAQPASTGTLASSSKTTVTPSLPVLGMPGAVKPNGAPDSWKPEITPALIAQVNEAASGNPTLQTLLQSAAKGEASQDQLKTLGFFIQSLATGPKAQEAPPAMYPVLPPGTTHPSMHAPYSIKRPRCEEPDLIIEFNETRGEKFKVPREIVSCEQEITETDQGDKKQRDILMYTFVPFVNDDAKFRTMDKERKGCTQMVIRLRNASHPLWECIRGWVNEESKKVDAWDDFFERAEKCGPRAYPQHRLANNELAAQVQRALQGYPMKLLKPPSGIPVAPASRSRNRPNRSKKLLKDSESNMDVSGTSTNTTPAPP